MSHGIWWDNSLFIKTYKASRHCNQCGKLLSIYNGNDRCNHHRTDDENFIERFMLCPVELRVKIWKGIA